jgi:predicted PurR-regulated permease PerM
LQADGQNGDHYRPSIELTGDMAKEPVPRLLLEPTSSGTGEEGPSRPERREFDRRVVRAAVIVNIVVLVTLVAALLAWRLRALLLLVVVSLFAAAVLHPIVAGLQRLGMRRASGRPVSRGVATTIVFVGAFLVASAIGIVITHPVITEATHFADSLPQLVKQAQHGKGQVGRLVARLHLLSFVQSKQANLQTIISKLSKPALAVGKTVISGIVSLVTVLFLTFFLLLEAPRIVRGVLAWMQPERSTRVRSILDNVGKAIVGYVLGNLLTSLIAGVVVGVALFVMGVPYVTVLALWVALVDFLPLIGGLLAGVPTVIVASLHSLTAGIVLAIVFLVYQEIENHFLNPLVMSRTVRLNPLWVLLAVLVGAELGALVGSVFGGLVGALIAVPTAGAIQVLARDLWRHRTGATLLDLAPTPTELLTAPLSGPVSAAAAEAAQAPDSVPARPPG